MSDSKKPGGGRDISELKQRLGLRKGAAAAQTGAQPRANGAATGGVVPPPGLNLPPPPGMAQPPQQPAAPAIPNAADDPFGAMNAMAHIGTVQRAPEIVIINDGRPVENVSAASRGATIAKLVLPAVAALAVGLGIGRISKDADFYNDGLRGARAIAGNVHETKKVLSDLDSALEDAKNKANFKPDAAIDKSLDALDLKLDVKSELVFRAKENSLDAEVAGQILSFYAGVDEVKSLLDNHTKAAKFDDMALTAGKTKADDAKLKDGENAPLAGQLRYAIVLSAPTDADKTIEFGAKFVEIGPPYCGDKLSTTGKCGENEQASGYAYRTEPGGGWTKGDIAGAVADSVPAKKLVLMIPNGVLDAVVKGTDAGASEALYTRRLKAIEDRTKKLVDEGNKLETRLNQEASKSTRFSFFL